MNYRIKIPYSDLIIKLAVIIFIFFRLFPTSDPFPPPLQEQGLENLSEGNLINQILNISVFFLVLIASVPKFPEIVNFVKSEKFLFLFLFWALLSVVWSNYPLVSFKRWFQIFNYYFLFITLFIYFPGEELIKVIKPIIYLYIIATLFVVITIPGAVDPAFNTWRGFAVTKNGLGTIGVIFSVLTFIIATTAKNILKKSIGIIFFFLSIIITLGTLSSTSYTALFIFFAGNLFYYLNKKVFEILKASNAIFITFVIIFLVSFIIIFVLIPEIPDLIQGIFGKSETFYDRGKLWTVMLWHIAQHPIIGCGFQAFWTLDNPQLLLLYKTFVWLPNQAHNGYLDLLNELGIVGTLLFLIALVKNLFRSVKYNIITPWLWLIILPLIMNITESNFMRVGPETPLYLIMSYLALEKIIESKREKIYN